MRATYSNSQRGGPDRDANLTRVCRVCGHQARTMTGSATATFQEAPLALLRQLPARGRSSGYPGLRICSEASFPPQRRRGTPGHSTNGPHHYLCAKYSWELFNVQHANNSEDHARQGAPIRTAHHGRSGSSYSVPSCTYGVCLSKSAVTPSGSAGDCSVAR